MRSDKESEDDSFLHFQPANKNIVVGILTV